MTETTAPTGTAATEQVESGSPPAEKVEQKTSPPEISEQKTQAKNRGLLLEGDGKPAGQQDDQQASEKTGDAEEEAGDQAEYDFTFPEGFKPNAELVKELKAFAGTHKLIPEEAQRLADLGVKLTESVKHAYVQAWEAAIGNWAKALPNHPVFGGASFEKNMATARLPFDDVKMREKFGFELVPVGLKQLLDSATPSNPGGLGLSNHPDIIHLFYNMGRLLADDIPLLGGGDDGGSKAMSAMDYYANMFPNAS
ncbi:MAG: hypothetical protein FD153_107 [Rhodospirillaceae bacterium]|nr:MAG: hypothetical protein FD153_107 [Rhodospirillaceae bacterium]